MNQHHWSCKASKSGARSGVCGEGVFWMAGLISMLELEIETAAIHFSYIASYNTPMNLSYFANQ